MIDWLEYVLQKQIEECSGRNTYLTFDEIELVVVLKSLHVEKYFIPMYNAFIYVKFLVMV